MGGGQTLKPQRPYKGLFSPLALKLHRRPIYRKSDNAETFLRARNLSSEIIRHKLFIEQDDGKDCVTR